ncbi:YhbD family protein [Clostridium oryzae]|uniref:DUF4004 family protein n=1 Tax=Clostridium oryzae TaxID=1450648 RepID=A0A1V4IPL5_9CLOT|nr:YhbD family protein [Clostridium oryzae]OPJ61407.1 hypothetical protein CLORY_22730 [Clostridium oryzae]
MDEELISKKELLRVMGISYGQLYRWKRKNIIPEEWFIKKSSFTGQETFFPKKLIIERIAKIMDMKDDLSLDDLAEKFSSNPTSVQLTREEILSNKLINEEILSIYEDTAGAVQNYNFENLLFMLVMEEALVSGNVSLDETAGILKNLKDNYSKFTGKNAELIFIRKLGVGISILLQLDGEIYLEDKAKLVLNLNISKIVEQLKLKLIELDK